ncbi:MAG: AraC family transcriptional regulator [Opitutales bacterium]|nr:AraC family transcriptional regulator [Opitutales bacterium]
MGIASLNSQLKRLVLKLLPHEGFLETAIPGFYVHRIEHENGYNRCVYSPKIILIVQGSKRAITGNIETAYHENQCLVSGIDILGTSCIAQATPQKPLLTITLDLNIKQISQMIAEMPLDKIRGDKVFNGLAVADADEGLMDAFLRLLKLLDTLDDIPVIAPVIVKEIYTRLLISPMGRHVRQLCTFGTQSNQITKAVGWLKTNYKKPIRINELAKYVNMAPTTFHRHFRKVTSISPIQYQKNLRLHEAKRLMISENETVANAAYAVGYESPTQFSREYKRYFGMSPKRDVAV